MQFNEMKVHERVAYFSDLISSSGTCYMWAYSAEGKLLGTNCDDKVLDRVFRAGGLMDYLTGYIQNSHDTIVLSIPHGLWWCASFELKDGKVERIWLLGPIATQDFTQESMALMINNSKVPVRWQPEFRKIIRRIPIMMSSFFFQYALMLNYCVRGEKITVADLVFYRSQPGNEDSRDSETVLQRDRIHTYMAEQELLRMVREGNLHYKKALENAASRSLGVGSGEKDALRHAQISQIVFISLCTRAAIEGGLSPETAYSKGDAYISDINNCTSVTDTVQIGHSMYTDFIQAVHNRKASRLFCPPVQSCCDYIETHLEQKIELEALARRIGYSEYYLSRKFKNETGVSINEYIRRARIDRAKILLATTSMSIQSISDRLCFGSRSFFADTFRKETGIPPAEYRKQNQKL